ncbi:WD40 repeat domain-containing protein [Streptomyces sp. NPDC085929]|uniref:WD40 repeat domain-containing protein n=1 Tax=Streptomyces sp. NPDC085929 TaxID=3365739 RepID=UPI0037D7DA66
MAARQGGPDAVPGPLLRNRWPLPDTPSPGLLRSLGDHGGEVLAMAITPDGQRVVTVERDARIRHWDPESGSCMATFPLGRERHVQAASITLDGSRAVVATGRTLSVWDAATGTRQTGRRTGRHHHVAAVAVAADASRVLVRDARDELRIWEVGVRGWRRLPPYYFDTAAPSAMTIAPDGAWVATARPLAGLLVWTKTTDSWRLVSNGYDGFLSAAPDGSAVAFRCGDGPARIWHVASGTSAEVPGTRGGQGLLTGPSGRWVGSSYPAGLEVRDAASGAVLAGFAGTTTAGETFAVAPDLTWAASAGRPGDGLVRLWAPGRADDQAPELRHEPVPFAVDPSGRFVAEAQRNEVVLRDLATGAHGATVPAGTESTGIAFTPDGRTLVGYRHGTYSRGWRWDMTSGVVTRAFNPPGFSAFEEGVFSMNGAWLAVGTRDHPAVTVWDARQGSDSVRVRLPRWHRGRGRMAMASDGTRLVVDTQRGDLAVWNTATPRTQWGTLTVREPVRSLAIAPDDTCLAGGLDDGTVQLWDLRTLRTGAALRGHEGPVRTLAFSPDGAWLATVDTSHTVRVWGTGIRQTVAVMRTDGAVTSCAWTANARHLILSGQHGMYVYEFRH